MGFGNSKINLSDEQKIKINKQMDKAIYNIKINNNDRGFGFLSIIPRKKIKILITDTHTLTETDFKDNKNNIIIINNKDCINISTDNRTIYMDKENDIIIIEIKDDEASNIDEKNFLEIDDNIYLDNPSDNYKSKEIYILNYNLKDNIFSAGKIKSINNKNYNIEHNCSNMENVPFSFPILLLNNFKIIGFNKSKNKAIVFKQFLDKFDEEKKKLKEKITILPEKEIKENEEEIKINAGYEEIKKLMEDNKKKLDELKKKFYKTPIKNIRNAIFLLLEVKKEDIHKNIYFLDKNENRKKGFVEDIEKIKNNIVIKILDPNEKDVKIQFNNKFIPDIEGIYTIEIEIPQQCEDLGYMFYDCNHLIYVDLSNFDFSNTTNMNDMFNYCINLKEIKFNRNNIEKVQNMSYMFNYCKNLEKIDLSNFNTKEVTNMGGMFQHCEKLKEINLENFDTNKVTQFSCMFNNCYDLTKIIFSDNFKTSKTIFMIWMFYGCERLEKLNLSSFVINKTLSSNMHDMFVGCDNLKEIKVDVKHLNYFKLTNNQFKDKFKYV